MSCMWVEVSECSQAQIYRLAQLLREEEDLKIVLSCSSVRADGERKRSMRVEKLLAKLGMPPHLKGYLYIKTALELCLKDKEELDGITKRLYPDVAKKLGTTSEKVEHAIRHAIEAAWKRGEKHSWESLFGAGCKEKRRPTNYEFISRLTEYLTNDTGFYFS